MSDNRIKNHLLINKQEGESLTVLTNIVTVMSKMIKDNVITTSIGLFDTNFTPPRLVKIFSDIEYEHSISNVIK